MTPKIKQLIQDMFDTMYDAYGVGLAAPQVGILKQVVVIDTTGEDPHVLINPEIIETSGSQTGDEGCLSLPGLNESVNRPSRIKIRYVDENFVEHDEEYDGFAARVIQHEYDHLDGIMFVDRLSPLRKTLIKGKLTSMSKGKYRADYRCKQVKK